MHLLIALQLQEVNQFPGGLVPHVYGELDFLGAWDPTKAVAMKHEDTTLWELSFVIPANHEPFQLRFLLKPKGVHHPYMPEEGPPRSVSKGAMGFSENPLASFRVAAKTQGQQGALLEFPVSLVYEKVSNFALAGCWKAHEKAVRAHGTTVKESPDVILERNEKGMTLSEVEGALGVGLEQYEVAVPRSSSSGYLADTTEEPRLHRKLRNTTLNESSPASIHASVSIKDLVLLAKDAQAKEESKLSVAHTPLSPRVEVDEESVLLETCPSFGYPAEPSLLVSESSFGPISDQDREDMPEASGAVAAAAVADRLMGPKERRRLAIVLVGLPARGKTFTASKLARYLRWLGHDTKHFNVGKYRRVKLGASQTSDFFRADNAEGVEARKEVAKLAFMDMLEWMEEGGQVGIFDATNSTSERRNFLLSIAEGKCKVIFVESMCNDRSIIERNALEKIRTSPDYDNMQDPTAALEDFRARLANYEKVYEPVSEGSYIKLIDMVGGGGQMQVNNISGYLPGRIVFFLVNSHITPRPILLTRHGESMDNVRGCIGGDPAISDAGEQYAVKLADFVIKRLENEPTASVWTSTLQRTILTARHIHGFPKVQWRALDEINAGVCDGMTYAEIKEKMPEEYLARKMDKLRYRYPRGESYLDVIQRLEPVIIELERQRSPVVVVAHQAICRALYAYFMDKPLREIPHIEMPLHTAIELTTGVGVSERRFKLTEAPKH